MVLGLGEELDALRAPVTVQGRDVGDPDVEERVRARRALRRHERDVRLVVGGPTNPVQDQPAVGDPQHHRVALAQHLRVEDLRVPLPGAVLTGDDEEVGEHEAFAGRGQVVSGRQDGLLGLVAR